MRTLILVLSLLLSALLTPAAEGSAAADVLSGVVDFHAHSAPDTVGLALRSPR
jgi:hypothetical protein